MFLNILSIELKRSFKITNQFRTSHSSYIELFVGFLSVLIQLCFLRVCQIVIFLVDCNSLFNAESA